MSRSPRARSAEHDGFDAAYVGKRRHDALEKRIGESRADYALFDTSKPLDRALFSFLASRQNFSRVR